MFPHIMIPTDASESGKYAAEIAIELAEWIGARVYAFHVLTPLAAVTYFSDVIQHGENSHREGAIARAREHLAAIESIAQKPGSSAIADMHSIGDLCCYRRA